MADFMVNLITQMMPDSDVLLFWVWVRANLGRLREATAELGITVEDGPGFMDRLEDAVTPVLVAKETVHDHHNS
jgi:hypothetical protein